MNKPIDFDAKFTAYAEKWMREQLAAGKKPEALEEQMPELYMRFINQKADWLDGETPAVYFRRWSEPEKLIEMMIEYEKSGVSAPDLLLERITDLGETSVTPLIALAANREADRTLRLTALNLLIELESAEPMTLCLEIVRERDREDELADVAAELLRNLGLRAQKPMLDALEGASDAAADTFLDLLCNFPVVERVYEEAVRRFIADDERRALHASFLAKLNDPRAIEPLRKVVEMSDINYLDFIEIRNAIEELGGEAPAEREFSGDPYYESMKRLEG